MNYNNWFYDQYKYLTGIRDGVETFNDTKWINMVERYKTLEEMKSHLLSEQPFGIMGNNYGFDQLLELMGRSNYTFEDLNKSLIDTYNVSLKNAMGKMLVNTQSVMFHAKNTDMRVVSSDKSGRYYIIDAPFNQLHFGDRDEFIRQKLHQMHTTENAYYIPMEKFMSEEISNILGFTIICTVNGYFCNDCQVALDDKGFKFKIKWSYSSDVDFIVYKLDESFVYTIEDVDYENITTTGHISSNELKNLIKKHGLGIGYKCLINIHDKAFDSSVATVPNFGLLSRTGLTILNLQEKTQLMIENNQSKKLSVTIYAIRYMHEVPNIYPSINYYEMIESKKVYDNKYENIKDVNGNQIVATSLSVKNNLEVCTPPISLDRSSVSSFNVIMDCFNIESKLKPIETMFNSVGNILKKESMTQYDVTIGIISPLTKALPILQSCYEAYSKASILTAIIPFNLVNEFQSLIINVKKTLEKANELVEQTNPEFNEISSYGVKEFYGDNFKQFVSKITKPFKDEKLETIYNMKDITKNYFVTDNTGRFNRPVSEQCFITLRYHFDAQCWLFDYPTIKHFHGISNTFYIDSNIEGNEVYKFFVLYTDTDNPCEKTVEPLNQETIFDFDLFVQEVSKHMGYIRYWTAENKLLKLCKIIYDKYDQDTCIQILSRILKRKIKADDILHIYPSDIEYEQSAIQSFNIEGGEDDAYAPFAINYLFYTLSMLYGNEDRLQTYFVNSLVNQKFDNRYTDVDITKLLMNEDRRNVNFARFVHSPIYAQPEISSISTSPYGLYYGIPYAFNSTGNPTEQTFYPYTFNVYTDGLPNKLIVNDTLSEEYYLKYNENINDYGYVEYDYGVDIRLAKIYSKYLTSVYSYISELQTNYTSSFNQTSLCDSAIETINSHINNIEKYINDNPSFMLQTSTDIAETIINDNPFISIMESLKLEYKKLVRIEYQGNNTNVFNMTNGLLADLRRVFHLFGFDNYALKPIRAMYIHLKKINSKMNLYEFRQWVSGINYLTIKEMDSLLAKNENYDMSSSVFESWAKMLEVYILQCRDEFAIIESLVSSLRGSFYSSHMVPIINHCVNIVNTYSFDMYTIKDITFNSDPLYDTEPYAFIVNVNNSDNHFHIPGGEASSSELKLIFYPKTEDVNGRYKIISVRNICDYTIFDGAPLIDKSVTVVSNTGEIVGVTTCSMTFTRVGSTSDMSSDISELISLMDRPIDFQNIHESFEVNVDNIIVNRKRTPMNYEMFIGNHFIPMESTLEMVTTGPNDLPGPVDRLYISNQKLNTFGIINYGDNDGTNVYFKPSQVVHIPMDENGAIKSIGGKYAEGQRIYLYTKNTGFVFPATITKIDWSQSHGFVEAVVDSYNSKWFKVTDKEMIETFFTTDIECGVIDDNISNFFDEFSNGVYLSYNIIPTPNPFDPSDEEFNTRYSMPGDPIYVTNNAPFVYTRLNYFFDKLVPNRFIDPSSEKYKMYHMRYIGSNNITDEKTISINMISHDFNPMTDPELFPILRTEPNDHEIWDEEKRVFNATIVDITKKRDQYKKEADEQQQLMEESAKQAELEEHLRLYQDAMYKYDYCCEFIKRLEYMIEEPEKPSTWYNVRSFEAASVYMNNGRAKASFIPNISYLSFTDKVDVFIYDWEHKEWLDPSSYSISPVVVNDVQFHNADEYKTDDVLYKLDIVFNNDVNISRKVLVYFGYNKSDIFDDIPINDKTCFVRFKPIISTSKPRDGYDMYSDIRIRKHFDGYERYIFDTPNSTGGIQNGYIIKRPKRTGEYMFSPTIRMCDMTVSQDDNTYDFTRFALYVRNPFKDTKTERTFKRPAYEVTINQPIDSFVPNQNIKLICISNAKDRAYDGNVSSVMFDAFTSGRPNNQKLTITNSSLDYVTTGKYICTVFSSSEYKPVGGVITISITTNDESIVTSNGEWIRIPDEFASYKELPDEFMIVSKNVTLQETKPVSIQFKNEYIKYSDDEVSEKNNSTFNPYEYYYDSENDIKLPISDVRRNAIENRLVVDTEQHPKVKLIKSPYIGICRYSLHHIPEDGIIDVTGYIPTPLSRSRYEFYVNGRNVKNTKNLHILSPTSFQLTNLRSLKNFELIELVDDMNRSNVFRESPVFVSLNGDICSSFKQVMLSNRDMVKQDIKYVFNVDIRDKLQDYTLGLIPAPGNIDVEPDILEGLYKEDTTNDYNKLYNIPTINGVQLMHLSMYDIGLVEIPDEKILDKFDEVWKREILTNPYFKQTHHIDDKTLHIALRSKDTSDTFPGIPDPENWICLYITGNMGRYISLYISNKEDGKIDDVNNTLKIIPFVKAGMYVLISRSYVGKYLLSTYKNSNVIKL